MRNPRRTLVALLCLASLVAGALSPAAAQQRGGKISYKETTLKNGLRVFFIEDHSAPVLTVDVSYNVGARNEVKGRTGFAHLFEHLMFEGSENVGKGEHYYHIFTNGGQMNGFTTPDFTTYYDTVPANQLEMALFMEADRMRALEVTQEKLDNQRHAVQEERRLGTDNVAYGKAEEIQQGLIYDDFPYHHTVIGSMEDLNAASLADVKQFFKTYYAPNNAVLTVVGDFKPDAALALIHKYFDVIPGQPAPPKVTINEPEQKAEKRQSVEDVLARLPQLRIAYKAAEGNTPDYYALDLLTYLLAGGQSSRLYQKLVKEKELVSSIGGYMDERRGPGAVYLTALVRPGKKIEDVEAAIYEEIDRIAKEPIADWELEKAKNAARRSDASGRQSTLNRAITMGQNVVFYNDPDRINNDLEKSLAVTKDDIRRVAAKYLQPTNRTVVITTPAQKAAPAGGEK
ncbi:MAG: insulinase family protein [Acidobacteriota bacterium]|nr:insulinase family protein [Acidobacteriota bacterium]